MKQHIFLFATGFSVLLGASFAPEQIDGQQQKATQQVEVYYCPMHTDISSDKPGECSKCGMDLVKKESDDEQQSQKSPAKDKVFEAKKLLADAKKQLAREGKYNCCIQDPCNQCALDHQSCPCATDLKAGKPVCPECFGGWQRGEGKDKSVKPSDVKTSYSTHKH